MGYITSFGYFQGAIWFYNLRAPQICFRNFWDQKIDRDETRDGCDYLVLFWLRCLKKIDWAIDPVIRFDEASNHESVMRLWFVAW